MTSKDVSFLSNIKKDKEGLDMLKSIKQQSKRKSFECRECGSDMEVSYSTHSIPYNVGAKEKELSVLNAPVYKCDNCGNEVISVLLYADIERAIEKEIFFRLNNRQEIPNEVEFSEFVKES